MQIDVKYIAKVTKTPSWKSNCNFSKTFLRTDHRETQNWLKIFKKMRSKKKKEDKEKKNAVLCFSAEICHAMSFLKAQVTFPSCFASIFSTIKHKSSVLFFGSNNIYFGQKQPIKVQIFEIFKCSGHNLSHYSCQFWTDSQFQFNFCIILHCHDAQLPFNF